MKVSDEILTCTIVADYQWGCTIHATARYWCTSLRSVLPIYLHGDHYDVTIITGGGNTNNKDDYAVSWHYPPSHKIWLSNFRVKSLESVSASLLYNISKSLDFSSSILTRRLTLYNLYTPRRLHHTWRQNSQCKAHHTWRHSHTSSVRMNSTEHLFSLDEIDIFDIKALGHTLKRWSLNEWINSYACHTQ